MTKRTDWPSFLVHPVSTVIGISAVGRLFFFGAVQNYAQDFFPPKLLQSCANHVVSRRTGTDHYDDSIAPPCQYDRLGYGQDSSRGHGDHPDYGSHLPRATV